MAEDSKEVFSFAGARIPGVYALARRRDDDQVEHAGVYGSDHALCGVTGTVTYRTWFDPDVPNACPECRAEAARTPPESQPSSQEHLYDKLESGEGPLRDELRQRLLAGAHVGPWMGGHAPTIARDLAFDRIIEGADAIREAFAAAVSVELIRARGGGRNFLVIIPRGGSPAVAVESTDPE